MAYIGREPQVGNFQVCDAISVVNGQAAYTMQVGGVNVFPETANHMLVSLNGILQAPTTSYTVSGSVITFASNLVTGDVIDFIQILGNVLDLGVPSDNTVSLAKLTATGTKDATTFLRGDNSFQEVPAGGITEADQWRLTAAINSNTDPISSNLERVDDASFGYIGNGMSVSSGVWTFPSTGIYHILTTIKGNSNSNGDTYRIEIYASTDGGSSYDHIGDTSLGAASTTSVGFTATTSNFIDVTNTSNVKIKFTAASLNSGSQIEGITSYNKTCFTFIRLGDT